VSKSGKSGKPYKWFSHDDSGVNDVCQRRQDFVSMSIDCFLDFEGPQQKSKINEEGLVSKRYTNACPT
jgi:hypothetical protein